MLEISSVEAPACKMQRITSVVVEQPGTDKILVDSLPDVAGCMDDVSCFVFNVIELYHSLFKLNSKCSVLITKL